MRLEAKALPEGPGFTLSISGRHQASPLWLGLAALFGLSFLALIYIGVPAVSPKLSPAARLELMRVLGEISHALTVGTGLMALLAAGGLLYSGRAYALEIRAEPGGPLAFEGGHPVRARRVLPAEEGPFKLVIVRTLRRDISIRHVPPDLRHLLAHAQEDQVADAALGEYIRCDVIALDARGTRYELLSMPGRLPRRLPEVIRELRALAGGTIQEIRGGGFTLNLPADAPGAGAAAPASTPPPAS